MSVHMHRWTSEEEDLAKRLWADGQSGAQIAKAIGAKSRNAVCGWLNKHGFKRSQKQAKQTSSLASSVAHKARKPEPKLLTVNFGANIGKPVPPPGIKLKWRGPLSGSSPKPLEERLSGECSWPLDGDAGPLSCCLPIEPEKVYCPVHCARAYQPTGVKKRVA